MRIAIVTLIVFLFNIPFGYWRANVRKFSLQWVIAIHIPVPFIIVLRIFSNIGFAWFTYIFLVGAFFSGQKLGYYLSQKMKARFGQATSFIFRDLLRLTNKN